jgi:prepilin-type N-terminal cleavage/methylation domain-containing protein
MTLSRRNLSPRLARGFSLLELMVTVAILTVIIGVAVQITKQLVRTNTSVSNNVDVVQQGRQFMDQISADLHQSGYPGFKMFDHTSSSLHSYQYAGTESTTSGVIAASPTALQFEGDVDNSGIVSEVFLRLCVQGTNCTTPTSSTQCPCTMQRGTISKQSFQSSGLPSYYTELTGVLNADIFTYSEYNGSIVSDTSTTEALSNIRNVRVKLQVRSQYKDAANGTYTVATLDSGAKFSN